MAIRGDLLSLPTPRSKISRLCLVLEDWPRKAGKGVEKRGKEGKAGAKDQKGEKSVIRPLLIG